MKRHIIYLATNANRAHIEAGYCQHIPHTLFEICEEDKLQFFYAARINRIVYMEEYRSLEEALKRKSELATYTRMMKERLIRKQNPNWLNITAGAHRLIKHTPQACAQWY